MKSAPQNELETTQKPKSSKGRRLRQGVHRGACMMGLFRRLKAPGAVVFIVVATVTLCCLQTFRRLPPSKHLNLSWVQARAEPMSETDSCPPSKRILVWNRYWGSGSDIWEDIFFRQTSRQCPESRCELVHNHMLSDTADAILFHPIDLKSIDSLPRRHSLRQLWIFFSIEPPPIVGSVMPVKWKSLGGLFNWTMSYRRDSDVVVPYGRVHPRPMPHTDEKDYWAGKSTEKMAVWAVSHCGTASRREAYVKELTKYIQVDTFGRCGKKKCGTRFIIPSVKKVNMTDCNNEFQRYMFYLAFENSICLDYITEKLYKALQWDLVPVVLGGGPYKDLAPPDSFVDALAFPSPEHLASYLKKLAADRDAYNKFFKWKQRFSVEMGHPVSAMVCDLCAKLHDPSSVSPPQSNRSQPWQAGVVSNVTGRDSNGSYPDIKKWFLQQSECRSWQLDPRQNTKQNAKQAKKQDATRNTKQNAKQSTKQDAKKKP